MYLQEKWRYISYFPLYFIWDLWYWVSSTSTMRFSSTISKTNSQVVCFKSILLSSTIILLNHWFPTRQADGFFSLWVWFAIDAIVSQSQRWDEWRVWPMKQAGQLSDSRVCTQILRHVFFHGFEKVVTKRIYGKQICAKTAFVTQKLWCKVHKTWHFFGS